MNINFYSTFLLFLIPRLLLGYFNESTCIQNRQEAFSNYRRAQELIEILNNLPADKKLESLEILQQAIYHVDKAYGLYNEIIYDIDQQEKDKRYKDWHKAIKNACKSDKEHSLNLLNILKKERYSLECIPTLQSLYTLGIKKIEEAKNKEQSFSYLVQNKLPLASDLELIIVLYEEAVSLFSKALDLITPTSLEVDKTNLKKLVVDTQASINLIKKELVTLSAKILQKKTFLQNQLLALKEESVSLEEKGLTRSLLDVQIKMDLILSQLRLYGEEDLHDISNSVQQKIKFLQADRDAKRLTEDTLIISSEKFKLREQERRERFFANTFIPPFNIEGLIFSNKGGSEERALTLYAEQFYRFNIQSDVKSSYLIIKVYENKEIVHEEKIAIPSKNTLAWNHYLVNEGLILTPETRLKKEFGLNLYLRILNNPKGDFSLLVAQKGSSSTYEYSLFLDEGLLYNCNFICPSPWQLGVLKKLNIPKPLKQFQSEVICPTKLKDHRLMSLLLPISPHLDLFVEELKKDPLLIAQYVHNEIDLVDPFLHEKNGFFEAPAIHRGVLQTFREKQGSPWEQCRLLVDLLRRAGHFAVFANGALCSLPKSFAKNMLPFESLSEKVFLKYPWVLLKDGDKWISLFPWMKEIITCDGLDLYDVLPEEYASADRFVQHYLINDEKILKYIGPDGDDTLGVLLTRFLEENLRRKGISLQDIGYNRTGVKKQFSSWDDFLRPEVLGDFQTFLHVDHRDDLFAKIQIEFSSKENPIKKLEKEFQLAEIESKAIDIAFSFGEEPSPCLSLNLDGLWSPPDFQLEKTDSFIEAKVIYKAPIGQEQFRQEHTFVITKGTAAALCFHLGGTNGVTPNLLNKQIGQKTSEEEKIQKLLSFMGAAYFEKCSRMESLLARLHKVYPRTILSFGLAKLTTGLSTKALQETTTLKYPQVDMRHIEAPLSFSVPNQESMKVLIAADRSSNEHQIIREVFKDPYAISTVKLLQIAHEEHQKKGYSGTGFLTLTSYDIAEIDRSLETSVCYQFSHLKDLNLRMLKTEPSGQWKMVGEVLDVKVQGSEYAYAYMTPGVIASLDSTSLYPPSYKGIGTFIIHPDKQYSLISQNFYMTHGGFGSSLSNDYIKSIGRDKEHTLLTMPLPAPWKEFEQTTSLELNNSSNQPVELEWNSNRFSLQIGNPLEIKADVRQQHKSAFDWVADPVDIISGAFYLDETDLVLSGSFPVAIRRNYNSQNPIKGSFGYGWKLNLNPTLVERDGKLYAAEEDGTVIVYRLNPKTYRWEVFLEDNPDLCNLSAEGGENPFHNYIENNTLYGADGSKRIFEDQLLRRWIDAIGNSLIFSYENDLLVKIETVPFQGVVSSFCRIQYDIEGRILEILAKDGRRIGYTYDLAGDLKEVEFPNKAIIAYEYDQHHRIFRETKPHGKVLENIYDDQGKVKLQRSPIFQDQKMGTSATFTYEGDTRTASDASGATTVYKIFNKKIYKIIDPQGYEILLSWFMDERTYFDPKKECVMPFDGPGGWKGSLKSSQDKRGLITNYLYDKNGNPEQVTFIGSDLTGDGQTFMRKNFIYNDINLCVLEQTSNKKTVTVYDFVFPYLPKRIEKYIDDTFISSVDFEYNSKGRLKRENKAGLITFYEYDEKGFLRKTIQKTGTDDPDVITLFRYNHQGQCIEKISCDGVRKEEYDLLGNKSGTFLYSNSGSLLFESFARYNFNNQCILTYRSDGKDPLYLDYNASGHLKTSRQVMTEENRTAYTLYEYNDRGLLSEEVDPLGNCTYREYDELSRIKLLTKSGHSTSYEYEAGGLLSSIRSPGGGEVFRSYTTNGLLKEEVFPDGRVNSFVYDFFGRPVREVRNGLLTVITYDDKNNKVIKQLQDKIEISEFDERGNLICFTDPLGYKWRKTYDALNRLTSEINPSGEKTVWNYLGDRVICTYPSLETTIFRTEMGHVVESMTYNSEGVLIAKSSSTYDPILNQEITCEGDLIQITQKNAYGKPTYITKGDITTFYEYDLIGNCIALTDGEGHTTHLQYDSLGRISQKELSDGAILTYIYDLDSNLTECHMPNNLVWKASYDLMGKKCFEELVSAGNSSQQFTYVHEKGLLKEMIDPLNRVHRYSYDSYLRLLEDSVDEWRRIYTYDLMDRLSSLEESGSVKSYIERQYNPLGRISLENIYLDGELLQQTHQTWNGNSRFLEIQDHKREFFYQGGQMKKVVSNQVNLTYDYSLNGSLKSKVSPLSRVDISYNKSALPERIHTCLPSSNSAETLTWNPSGKLATHTLSKLGYHLQQTFTYDARGQLVSSNEGTYGFDFERPGLGIRTKSPESAVQEIDPFGKVSAEKHLTNCIEIAYDLMGQVVVQNDKAFTWDPWGRLLSSNSDSYYWKASYDGLGRRLKTEYIPKEGLSTVTVSFYDPEKEFLEIGITCNGKNFWKIYGPTSCDAILDSSGSFVYLMQDALWNLNGVVSAEEIVELPTAFSPYGPSNFTPFSDLTSYALSLVWQNKSVDPTGLIWMGARYYDPIAGRFLSPDPISYPACLSLYTYANGDPVNYFDPDGRFASKVFDITSPVVLEPSQFLDAFKTTTKLYNKIPTCLAKIGLTGSKIHPVGSFELPRGAIGYTNGINNIMWDFVDGLNRLSKLGGSVKIHGVYNSSSTFATDIIECGMGHVGLHSPPVQLLKDKWAYLTATHGPDSKFLEICHSGGADQLKNALATSPRSVQQQIIVVAIAPSVIIPRELCFESYNYTSKKDFVTHLDLYGKMMYGDQLRVLEPHQDASWWDHGFLSPTFDQVLKYHIDDYMKNYGEVQ